MSNYITPRGKGLDHTAKPAPPPPAASTAKPIAPAPPLFDLDGAIAKFGRAYRATDWSQAQEVLGRVRASGLNPDPFDLNHFERLVQQAIEAEKRQREQEALEAERQCQYQRIVDFVDMFDKATVWDTLQRFWQTFPDYDPEQIAKRVRPQKKLPSHELLPQPFAWIKVPKGKVTLIEDYWEDRGYLRKGQQQTFDVEAFEIGKYPVTVAQYTPFVEANGYGTQAYWTPAGWQWRTKNTITVPRFWENPQWHQPDHPIVGVSWYEALAYCQWLSAVTGEAIHLPTEQQWQRAGQGDDGRLFPWGNNFDPRFCNNSVEKLNSSGTTAVTQYEEVKSPYGTKDQSGNVWEWCLTDFDSGKLEIENTNSCVVRGGSWIYVLTDVFRVVDRYWVVVDYGYYDLGFRLARSLNQF